ncbi:hypothetical protein ACOSP7_010870 [Xanthoceras sorbifolium]
MRALQYLGLERGEALKVNLILPDYFMPGMTGSELLKKIKESSAFKEIRVVIMSSENIIVRIVTVIKFKVIIFLIACRSFNHTRAFLCSSTSVPLVRKRWGEEEVNLLYLQIIQDYFT